MSSKKFKEILSILRYLPQTVYFNFKYLPLKQAVHLPIFLYKPKFKHLGGSIELRGGYRHGLIRLGFYTVDIYPNTGIMLNLNGRIVFNGSCNIGNNSYISTGEHSLIEFGKSFTATTTLRLVSYHNITFGNNVLIGWDCMLTDTDFHRLTNLNGKKSKGYGEIKIGNNNWIANGCRVLKNVSTPDNIVIGAYTVLTSKIDGNGYKVVGNDHEIKTLSIDRYLDQANMKIDYTKQKLHSNEIYSNCNTQL